MDDPAPHEIFLLLMATVALVTAAIKAVAMKRRKHDGRGWLRFMAIIDCLYLATLFTFEAFRLLLPGPVGIALIGPGIVVSLTLEAIHGRLDW